MAAIAGNETCLEQITGQPVRFFGWPFGASNYSAVKAASAVAIVAALGLDGTAAQLGALDPYRIPRLMVFAAADLCIFSAKFASW